jgi:hypothetical protein
MILMLCLESFKVIKSRRLRWVGHGTRVEEMRSAYNILAGKPAGKTSLRRTRLGGRIF